MTPRTILVMGATGKQGRATVEELCKLPSSKTELRILAVTRNAQGDAAFDLKRKLPQVEIVQGDYDNLGALFDSLPATPDAVFSVQPTMNKGYTPQREANQGKGLHEAAIDIGVGHIVYTSVDRHGADSDLITTKVPHFDSKMEIEAHLQTECARLGSRTTWTILRPTTFFDNLTPDLVGRVVAATIGKCPRPQQMVAVRDIGWFAARALTGFSHGKYPSGGTVASATVSLGNDAADDDDPAAAQIAVQALASARNPYAGRKIGLAGDELGLPAMRERFYERMGYPLPEAYAWMGAGALWASKELGAMYEWLGRIGYKADIEACRAEHPGMLRFGDWVEKESGFTRGGEVLGSWLS